MEYHVLGSLEVLDAGIPMPLRGERPRALLAILLTRAGKFAPVDWLTEELWGGAPPDTAASALRVHVTALRRVLEPDRARSAPSVQLPLVNRGYCLTVGPDQLDAQRFERAAVLGANSLAAGSPDDAVALLEPGLSLWRGRPFEGLEDIECVRIEIQRLEALRMRAHEDLMDGQLAIGQHAAVIGALADEMDGETLRERTTAQLALALYRSGRQADALRVIARLRSQLREQLGLEPTPSLANLELAILEHSPELEIIPSRPTAGRVQIRGAASPSDFAGRKRELDMLRVAYESVRGGSRRAVFVSGAPGIGKTALGALFGREAEALGAAVCFGRCDAQPIGPFQPFREALRALLRMHPIDPDHALAAELARLVPDVLPDDQLNLRAASLDAERDRHRLFEAVARLLRDLPTPVVFVFDDLQWGDAPSLLLAQHLVRHEDAGRVLIVGLFRDVGLLASEMLPTTVRRLCRTGLAESVALAGLEHAEVEQLVRAVTPPNVLDHALGLVPQLCEYTGGNPFFLGHVLHALGERSTDDLPDDLAELLGFETQDLVAERLDCLTPRAVLLLRTAAVIGLEFDLGLLAEASLTDEDAVLEAIEEGLGTRLLRESSSNFDRFEFAHSLVRDVVYRAIPTSRRKRLHRDIGAALERLSGEAVSGRSMELAHHYLESVPIGDSLTAVGHALNAAKDARESLAFEVSVSLCTRGLAALDGQPDTGEYRCDLMLEQGRCQHLAGQAPARDTLLGAAELAAESDDANRMASSLLSFNRGFFARTGQTDRRYVGLLEQAIGLRGPHDDPTTSELLATLASELVWADGGEIRFRLSDDALAMARRIGDGATLARVLLLRQMAISAPDTVQVRRVESLELLRIADQLEDDTVRFQAAFHASGTAHEAGDVDAAHDLVALAGVVACRLGQPNLLWLAEFVRTGSLIGYGRLEEAEASAERALDLGGKANHRAEAGMFFGEQLFEIRRWQGRLGEVVDLFADLAGVPSADFGFPLLRYLLDAGRTADATRIYRELIEVTEIPPRRDLVTLPALCNLAYVGARIGDEEHGQALYDALAPWADLVAKTTVSRSVGHHYLGLLAASMHDHDRASSHLAAAMAAHRSMHLPLLAAEAAIDLAEVRLLQFPDEHDAVIEELVSARKTAARHGAAFLDRRCDELRGAFAIGG